MPSNPALSKTSGLTFWVAPPSGGAPPPVVLYPTTTTLASDLNPSNHGELVTFTATVASTGTPTGTCSFISNLDGVLGAAAVMGGTTATFPTSALSSGTHSMTASYNGDANFSASTSPPLAQTVNSSAIFNLTTQSSEGGDPLVSDIGEFLTSEL